MGLKRTLLAGLAALSTLGCDVSGLVRNVSCEATLYTTGALPPSGAVATNLGLEHFEIGSRQNNNWTNGNAPLAYVYVADKDGWPLGSNLELLGCDAGLYLQYAGARLATVAVQTPWNGTTDAGLRLGDSRDDFLASHPLATGPTALNADQDSVYTAGNARFWIQDGVVRGIEISTLPVTNIGPDQPRYVWR